MTLDKVAIEHIGKAQRLARYKRYSCRLRHIVCFWFKNAVIRI